MIYKLVIVVLQHINGTVCWQFRAPQVPRILLSALPKRIPFFVLLQSILFAKIRIEVLNHIQSLYYSRSVGFLINPAAKTTLTELVNPQDRSECSTAVQDCRPVAVNRRTCFYVCVVYSNVTKLGRLKNKAKRKFIYFLFIGLLHRHHAYL